MSYDRFNKKNVPTLYCIYKKVILLLNAHVHFTIIIFFNLPFHRKTYRLKIDVRKNWKVLLQVFPVKQIKEKFFLLYVSREAGYLRLERPPRNSRPAK